MYMLRCRYKLLYIVFASWPIMKDNLAKTQTFLYMKIVFHTFLLRKPCHSCNKLVKTLEPQLLAKSLGSRALTRTYYQSNSIC